MALFKILKGKKEGLPSVSNEGWVYVTEDTSDMYIFTTTNNRIQLNADKANTLRDSSDSLINEGSATQPVYFSNGKPVVCSGELGAIAQKANALNLATGIGDSNTPIYFNSSGLPVVCGDTLDINITGTADSASKANALNVSTSIGSSSTPVYINSSGIPITCSDLSASKVYVNSDISTKLYVLGASSTGNQSIYRESSVYLENNVLFGAAWNDYAEYRKTDKNIEPGRVVCETGQGNLILSDERLQPGGNIVSDTFGFAIGQTEICQTPIAVSGRVLAYPYENRDSFKAGDAVCSGPNGTVSKMTREEIKEYPERIIGTVSEVPEYTIWGENNIEVKNRIWIKVK